MRLDITLTTRRSRGQRMHSLYRQLRQEIRCHLRNRGCAWWSHGQSMDGIPVPWVTCQSVPFPRAKLRPSSQDQVDQVEAASWLSPQLSGLRRFRGYQIRADGAGVTSPNLSWRGYPRHDALERYERDLIDRLELMGAPSIPGTASPPWFCLA